MASVVIKQNRNPTEFVKLVVKPTADKTDIRDMYDSEIFEYPNSSPTTRFDSQDPFRPVLYSKEAGSFLSLFMERKVNKYLVPLSNNEIDFLTGIEQYFSGTYKKVEVHCDLFKWGESNHVLVILLAYLNYYLGKECTDITNKLEQVITSLKQCSRSSSFNLNHFPYANRRKWYVDGKPLYADLYSTLYDEYIWDSIIRRQEEDKIELLRQYVQYFAGKNIDCTNLSFNELGAFLVNISLRSQQQFGKLDQKDKREHLLGLLKSS
jgi:hypothetical protein